MLGFLYGDKFTRRSAELCDLEKILIFLQKDIEYAYSYIPEALIKASSYSTTIFSEVFRDIGNSLNINAVASVSEAFYVSINKYRDSLNLKELDYDIIKDLSQGIEEGDIEGQRKVFSLSLSRLRSQIEEAAEMKKKNVRMYRYLGICLGLMVVILIY